MFKICYFLSGLGAAITPSSAESGEVVNNPNLVGFETAVSRLLWKKNQVILHNQSAVAYWLAFPPSKPADLSSIPRRPVVWLFLFYQICFDKIYCFTLKAIFFSLPDIPNNTT